MFARLFPQGSFRRIVAGNTLSQLIGRAVSTVTIAIVSLLIAKQYGPSGYGDFVKITTYVAFFYLIADFGLNAIYLQRAANLEIRSSVTSTSASWRLLLGLRLSLSVLLVGVALAILAVLPQGLNQGYTPLVRWGIVMLVPVIVAQAVTTTTNAVFQKLLRYDLATRAQNAGSIITLLVALILSWVGSVSGSYLGVFAVMAGSLMTALVALLLVQPRLGTITPQGTPREYMSYLRSAAPLGLALIFNLIYFHADSVILTLTRSTAEVGIYGLAYKLFELPLVIPIFFMNSVFPLMLSHAKDGGERKIFMRSLQFLLLSAIAVGGIGWLAAPVVTLVRPDFLPSVAPLRVLILGLPVFFVSALFMWLLIARKQQKVLLIVHGMAMVGNIACNLLLVPVYGYMAAAWITIYSELFVLGVTAVVALRQSWSNAKGVSE